MLEHTSIYGSYATDRSQRQNVTEQYKGSSDFIISIIYLENIKKAMTSH